IDGVPAPEYDREHHQARQQQNERAAKFVVHDCLPRGPSDDSICRRGILAVIGDTLRRLATPDQLWAACARVALHPAKTARMPSTTYCAASAASSTPSSR